MLQGGVLALLPASKGQANLTESSEKSQQTVTNETKDSVWGDQKYNSG